MEVAKPGVYTTDGMLGPTEQGKSRGRRWQSDWVPQVSPADIASIQKRPGLEKEMAEEEPFQDYQVSSLDLIAEEPKDFESRSPPPVPRPLPSLEGWRGLAHYRTESRRSVVKKKPQDRTPSDLYIMEESVKSVKLIGDLPLAKRLEHFDGAKICRFLGYEKWEPSLTVYQQGHECGTFYILFTGLVRASVHVEGVQEDKVTLMLPGDCFGELALSSKEKCIMTETAFTTERSELLTLSKKDYENILKIQKNPEIRERVKFLKSIAAFSEVSKHSLYRLANVLSSRIYTKNRGLLDDLLCSAPSLKSAVTFQGDEAFEMFFVRSGECRIIMEITSARKQVLRLPRVSTFLYEQSPTRHHRCKAEIQEREKNWGRPSLVARFSARMPSAQASSFDGPRGLGQAILDNRDLLSELAVGHSRVAKSQSELKGKKQLRSRLANANSRASRARSSTQRSVSMPNSARHGGPYDTLKENASTGELSPWGGSPKAVSEVSPRIPIPRKIQKPEANRLVIASPRVKALVAEERTTACLPLEKVQYRKQASSTNETGIQSARFKKTDLQERTYQGKRRKRSKPRKYTLSKFLSEVEQKDKKQRDVDFSVKEHALWHMSVSQSVMKSAFSEDVKYYRNKFQTWARGVLAREKQLLGFNIYDNYNSSPSFTPGAGEGIQRLEQGPGPEYKNRQEGTMILDIGALTAGDYFGERGLLKKSRRAVSILTISPVEALVLNVWDFHRHCDRDVIEALAAHDYRKEEQIYKQYLRNCRWERFKKKVLDEVLEAKAFRTYMKIGIKAMRYVPKEEGPKVAKRIPNEWK